MSRACFAVPEPPDDAIPFVLTARERDAAAQYAVQLEAQRRKQNRRDAARSTALSLQRLAGEEE